MEQIPTTSLMRNADGSIYHLHLLPEQLADNIITVGDPGRVPLVSDHFDHIEYKITNREFITHIGKYKGQPIMVTSTGIGTANVEIVLNELDALANIDFNSNTPKNEHNPLNIIRIGTSGSIQKDVAVDTHIVSQYGIGLDTLMHFYSWSPSSFEQKIAWQVQTEAELPFLPYCVKGSDYLKNKVVMNMESGNTVTCPGFYASQGRQLRYTLRYPDFLKKLYEFDFEGIRITNFEMETAAYYALGRVFGHEVLSVNAIIADRYQNEFSKDPELLINSLIVKILDGFN